MFKVYGNEGKAINHIDKKDFKEKKVEKSFKYCGWKTVIKDRNLVVS